MSLLVQMTFHVNIIVFPQNFQTFRQPFERAPTLTSLWAKTSLSPTETLPTKTVSKDICKPKSLLTYISDVNLKKVKSQIDTIDLKIFTTT